MDGSRLCGYAAAMRPARLPAWLMPWALRAVHLRARLVSPLTVGVRAVVLDDHDRVFLVKHSYVPGWHLPGGGVEPGESVHDALRRELREETDIELSGVPTLHGIFFNRAISRRDHVVVFVVRSFRVLGPRKPDWEIVDSGFFERAALPAGVAHATLARLDELRNGRPPADIW
jgi:8-oxo-dGTP pyrophosphatase MutT (NUDIX family)